MRSWLHLLALVLLPGCAPAAAPPPGAPVTTLASASASAPAPLPDVMLSTLEREPVRLTAFAGGKVALVSLWATWCEACVAELDALNRLDAQARKGGALVIGVAVGETPESAAAFAHARKLTYPQLVDEDFTLSDALGQRRVPTTLVLDRSGRIVYSGGALSEEALAAFRAAMGGG